MARLADALAALHEKKCLHGAVKPSIRPSLRVIGVRLQDVAGRGSRDRQPHRAVQLHAVDLEEQLRTCSGVSVGASSSMSDRTPTGQDERRIPNSTLLVFPNNAAEAGRNPDTLAGEPPTERRASRSSGRAADAPPGAAGRQTPARRGRNAVPGLQDSESDTGYDTRRRAPDGALAVVSQTTVYDTAARSPPSTPITRSRHSHGSPVARCRARRRSAVGRDVPGCGGRDLDGDPHDPRGRPAPGRRSRLCPGLRRRNESMEHRTTPASESLRLGRARILILRICAPPFVPEKRGCAPGSHS